MKKFLVKAIPLLLILFVLISLGFISVSASVSYTNSKGSVKVVCGSYKKTFKASKYGNNFSAALNSALDTARTKAKSSRRATVTIAKGHYRLDRTILVYSNTNLVATGSYFRYYGNTLRNGFDYRYSAGYGYNSARNITVTGGEWEQLVNYANAGSSNTSIMHSTFRFAHCNNIKVTNASFKNNYNCHDIEIAGVKDAEIADNTFYNTKSVNGIENDGGRESVQIDVTTSSAMPFFPSYDKTPCKNISVHNNIFRNKFRAVGSHHGVTGKTYNKISVYNNKMDNIAGISVYAVYWTNSKIYGNEMSNVGFGIDMRSMINNAPVYNYYNLNNLSYQDSEKTVCKSKTYIYNNNINIRAKDNVLLKPCGIRTLGDYYSKDDSETKTKAGIYRIYNVNIGVDSNGNSKPNNISGNFTVGIQVNYGVKPIIKNNTINLFDSDFSTANGIELKGCENANINTNKIINGKSSSSKGIYVYDSSANTLNSNVKITNNIIKDFAYAGISVQKTDSAAIKNNRVENCGSASLFVKSTVSAVISGNILKGGACGASFTDYPDTVSFNSNTVSDTDTGLSIEKARAITAEKNSFTVNKSAFTLKNSNNIGIAKNTINSSQYGVGIYNDCDFITINKNNITSASNCVFYNGGSSSDKNYEKTISVTNNRLDSPADTSAVRVVYDNVFADFSNNFRSDNAEPNYLFKGDGETKYSGYNKQLTLDALTLNTVDGSSVLSWSTNSDADGYRVYLNGEFAYDTSELSQVLEDYYGEKISVVPYKNFSGIKLSGDIMKLK